MTKLQEILMICTKYAEAPENQHAYITSEHLLMAVLSVEDDLVMDVVDHFKIDVEDIVQSLGKHLREHDNTLRQGGFIETPALRRVLMRASAAAKLQSLSDPEAIDIFLSVLHEDDDSYAAYYLRKYIGDMDELLMYIQDIREVEAMTDEEMDDTVQNSRQTRREQKMKSALDKYCDNLNTLVEEKKIDPLIGRHTEIAEVTKTLARRRKNNVILVGDGGVGKTAVAEGLAYRIVHGEVAHTLENSVVYSLNMGSLISGAKYRGEFEERLIDIVNALKMMADNGESPILFIDEIHTINGAGAGGSQGNLDMANLLKPALNSGMKCIGSTTSDEYRKTFEKDQALARRFHIVRVSEPSVADTIEIIKGIASYFEEFHNVKYSEDAIISAVNLTSKYIHNKKLPDKAIDIIDRVGAVAKIAQNVTEQVDPTVIDQDMVENEVSIVANIPKSSFDDNEEDALGELDVQMRSHVFGQDSAIEQLVENYLVARAGLRDEHKPIGSYLFTGPTGVGKTEVAKTLAKQLGVPLHRFDMSEYMEQHTISKLIGSPPGYVGYEEEGQLIKAIEDSPSSVVLLDEIEKAHPNIYNILLQVMDNGELTSSKGKTVSFRNVIIIMTSNAGASEAAKSTIGFGATSGINTDAQQKAVEKTFTPEFRNRLDSVVQFDSLSPDILMMIVDKFINQLNERADARNVFVEVTKEAKAKLLDLGYDEKMGARPMERAIQENITKNISREILFGHLKDGGVVTVGVVDNEFNFTYGRKQEVASVAETVNE